jgi:hypothetical protein
MASAWSSIRITIRPLKQTFTRAVNVELTPTYEEAAGERRVMDFVETGNDVEAADYVVLNRVICCYPDMPRLTAAIRPHGGRRVRADARSALVSSARRRRPSTPGRQPTMWRSRASPRG